MPFTDFAEHLSEKWQKIMDNEVRYTTYQVDDADMVLVSYGSSGRACRDAVDMGRAKGIKLGLFRPITLWPFPHQEIHALAQQGGKKFVAVEDSMT
jgi:2-oxoisovalerate ferredoxin oxidoreductase alpha subunit